MASPLTLKLILAGAAKAAAELKPLDKQSRAAAAGLKQSRDALKLLPLGVDNVRLYVNPQDFEQAKALRERHEESWRIVEDDSLLPGGCRVETEHSRIDASIETRVTQVMAKLFDQLHEQALHPAAPDLSLDIPEESQLTAAPEEPLADTPDAP